MRPEESFTNVSSDHLILTPGTARLDEQVQIRVTGLEPGQQVTIRAEQQDEDSKDDLCA